jgi:TRAP-type C4-dicarboxylate transport system substrate-binding protein
VKKNIPEKLCLFIVMVFMAAIFFNFKTLAASETITLTFATNTAPVGLRGIAEKGFVEEIERLGEDRIRIKVYWRQSYLIDKEILDGVKDGTVDMGHVNINYYPNRLLVNGGITLLQRGPDDYDHRMRVYDRIYREIPELNAEFKQYKQRVIYTYSVLPLTGCFTRHATSLKDFKDRRIRTASRWLLKILKGTGAVPIGIPWADCYLALKTNALEGVFTNLDAIHRVKLDQVAPNIVIFRELWNPVPFHITINLDSWNRLPKDVQQIIKLAAQNARQRFSHQYSTLFDKIVSDQKKAGIKVSFASKKDIEQWLSMEEIEKIKAQWVKEVNLVKGAENAQEILDSIEQIVSEEIRKSF